ncbi:alpha/beta fold hydrolase [Paraburkholderia panacisoli]|nr:alpha/beta fold hydrolase [Paraburkholderia panacisoli]
MKMFWLMATAFLAMTLAAAPPGLAEEKANDSYFVHSTGDKANSLVIFVHGVLGDSRDTWRRSPSSAGWPELLAADPAMPGVDTLAIGFKSAPLSSSSNIEELANRLSQMLIDQRLFERYDNIAFVAHSMGGLITKRAVLILRSKAPESATRIKAVIFLATPAEGSDKAALANWFSANPQFGDMRPADFNSFLQLLDNDWASMLRRREGDSPYPRSFCAYETQPTGLWKVVPRSASQKGCDDTPVAFDRTHSGIAKPAGRDDEVYRYVLARLAGSFDPKLVKQHVIVQIQRIDGKLLGPADFLRSGEQYSVSVRAVRPAWFYVFVRDSTDSVQRYYPTSSDKQAAKQNTIRVPEHADLFITLDRHRGTELIYVFALDQRDDKLERAATEVSSSANVATGVHVTQKVLLEAAKSRGGAIEKGKLGRVSSSSLSEFGQDVAAFYQLEHR